jgi:hypothetical protein
MRPNAEACRCAHALSADWRRDIRSAEVAVVVSHLYICEGLSTYRIGQLLGMNRQRVGRLLVQARVPVKPRGAGRRRQLSEEEAAAADAMARLYVEAGFTTVQISALTGVPDRTVRDRLRARGVRLRTRGPLNREDRRSVPADAISELYVAGGLSAADVGRLLGVSGQIVLRAAHDEGLPVRVGGPEPSSGPAEIELIDALYADVLVRHALARHGIARSPAGGAIWQRFPVPLHVAPELAIELYVGCGLSVRHIELLTGQPSQTILRLLDAQGVARRPAGGRSPFLRRWRAGIDARAGDATAPRLSRASRIAAEDAPVEKYRGPPPGAGVRGRGTAAVRSGSPVKRVGKLADQHVGGLDSGGRQCPADPRVGYLQHEMVPDAQR